MSTPVKSFFAPMRPTPALVPSVPLPDVQPAPDALNREEYLHRIQFYIRGILQAAERAGIDPAVLRADVLGELNHSGRRDQFPHCDLQVRLLLARNRKGSRSR